MSILPLLDDAQAVIVRKLVIKRLAAGRHDGSLVSAKDSLTPKDEANAKYALIEIRLLNPVEELSEPETALLRGISLDTLQREKAAENLAGLNAKAKYPQNTRK